MGAHLAATAKGMIVSKLRERDIEDYLVRRVKSMGGEVRKVNWPGRKSAPDRVVMLPYRWHGPAAYYVGRCTWVELKRPGGLVTFPKTAHERAQHREHERMREAGQHVVVIDSFAGVDALLA